MSGFKFHHAALLALSVALPAAALAQTVTQDALSAYRNPTLKAYIAVTKKGPAAPAGLKTAMADVINPKAQTALAIHGRLASIAASSATVPSAATQAPSGAETAPLGMTVVAAGPELRYDLPPTAAEPYEVAQSPQTANVATTKSPDILTLPVSRLSGADAQAYNAQGLAASQGVKPAVPDMAELDRLTADAVIAAFKDGSAVTADDAAQNAAATAGPPEDPALTERVALARTVFRVDGTEDIVRHFVNQQHMKLIIGEVNNHIDISKLSENDKYRMSAIAAQAQTQLGDKILNLNAHNTADALSKPELMQLIVSYDIDAQRKQTAVRLGDSGKMDRAIDLDLSLARTLIVKQYETGQ